MSSYNLKDKFIYIHIPKTAGTSMEDIFWIGKGFNKHEGIEYFHEQAKHNPDGELDIDKFWKWTFVRNPYNRFMSGVINHVLKGRFIEMGTDRSERLMKEEITKFIIKIGDGYNYPRHAVQSRDTGFDRFGVLKQQNKYVTIDGENVMDFIGRFERLQEDLNKVAERFGYSPPIMKHLVRGYKIDYDSLYTPETREIIRSYYSDDFEMFDYE